ncbi:tetratricopeptide repeat protein [Sphingobacterium hungaricum]|uniref:Gliding motility protein n=1 Tax=Sphingobacterium hungaricum TaxID=2082723 RepID=A0A928UUQ6_9SPHI|nr:tetratricopeptide repeat protein [Sphingobacterium hungaricum]MBE8713701.1 gliding motility protein [Sphingobacterium hungaricum]
MTTIFRYLPIFGKKAQILFSVFAICLCIASCSVSKAKRQPDASKDKEEKRYSFMQNVTSKYNILYNAGIMLDQEQASIAAGKKENYQVRLTVFDEPEALGDAHKLMDSVIGKAYKVINTKTESKYINEANYVIAQANYLKGSYYTSVEFLNYLIKNNEPEQLDYRPKAYAWKSRAFLQMGKLEQAAAALDSALRYATDNKQVQTFVNASQANYFVRIGEESQAIPYLEQALATNHESKNKNRWTFLLAQLYKENGQLDLAEANFSKIARSNVAYDMSFEASMQAAYLKASQYPSVEEQVKPLKKLLKEGKSEGYKDQILYEIGRMYLAAEDEKKAFEYFNQSLRIENGSMYQRAETYLTLADYSFDTQHYTKAQNYYDSLASVLPADYTDLNKLRRKLAYMSELTALYEENLWQDTLIHLASLPEGQLESTIEEYAQQALALKKIEIEREKALAKQNAKGTGISSTAFVSQNTFANTNTASTYADDLFYFNNADAVSVGSSDFKRRWGNRQLKDDWRFSADQTAALVNTAATVSPASTNVVATQLDEAAFLSQSKNRYLQAIPKTKEAYDSAYAIIHDNMIVIGNIYRDYTKDPTNAILAYEKFLERFPATDAAAEIYYSLYRMYDGIDQSKSQSNKQKLITSYPNSIHAKVASDPNYMEKLNREKKTLDLAFEQLFTLYSEGKHDEVVIEADKALNGQFANSGLVAQIEYLKALAIGRVGRVEDFTAALENLVVKFPDEQLVKPLAKEHLAFMNAHPDYFANRVNALQDRDKSRIAFVDEPDMTAWPQLSIKGDYRTGIAIAQPVPAKEIERPIAKVEEIKKPELIPVIKEQPKVKELEKSVATLDGQVANQQVTINRSQVNTPMTMLDKQMEIAKPTIDFGPNEYRDNALFPDEAIYYFVINVNNPSINLSPSRYGVGQFIRTRFSRAGINHQLKPVNDENQLVLVGTFRSYQDVKDFESKILPMMGDIMKIPSEIYNTFVVTRETLDTLTDSFQLRAYHQVYTEQ